MIYNIDSEPVADPEPTQYRTRRERREVEEGRSREDDLSRHMTRRDLRKIDRANEYLDLQEKDIDTAANSSAQREVIEAHRKGIQSRDWSAINALNDSWIDMQPSEEKQELVIISRMRRIGKVALQGVPEPTIEDEFSVILHEAARRQTWVVDELAKRNEHLSSRA